MSYSDAEKNRDVRLLDLVEKRYNYELQRQKDLDSKANNLIGYVSIITTLILGIGAFQFLNSNLLAKGYNALYFIGVFTLVCSITASLVAMIVRKFQLRPNYDDIKQFFLASRINEMNIIRDTIDEMNEATKANNLVNNQKGLCILIGNLLLIIGIIFLLSYTTVFTYDMFNGRTNQTNGINKTIVHTLSQLDDNTLNQFFSGKKQIEIDPNDTVKISSPFFPNTTLPWVETQYQWLKNNLNVYIVTDSKAVSKQNIAAKAVKRWIDLLKNNSDNSAIWNVSIYNIIEGNYTLYKIHPPDITLHLDNDPQSIQCSEEYGKAMAFRENKFPQYAKIFLSCGGEQFSNERIYTTVLHEFAHTIGLGHVHNKAGDLLCSIEEKKPTCSGLPNNRADVSDLDIRAALYIYGNDGFGGLNRVLVNRPYYLEAINQKLAS